MQLFLIFQRGFGDILATRWKFKVLATTRKLGTFRRRELFFIAISVLNVKAFVRQQKFRKTVLVLVRPIDDMKDLLGKIFGILFIALLVSGPLASQETDVTAASTFNVFQKANSPSARFSVFFETKSRYKENSAYDWLEMVNKYLNEAAKSNDSLEITQYSLMQAQIYHDLGEYDRSAAITKEIYNRSDSLNIDMKSALLDIMDNNFGQLGLYTEQIDIRKEKKNLGIADNIAFYDIYSNLGLPREAMEDYIDYTKKTLDEKNYQAVAIYNNTIGTFLRLDNSIPTALTKYKQARSYSDLNMIDATNVKSEDEVLEAKLLHAKILGNIGKCYVELQEYEDAIPHLETSLETLEEYGKGTFSSEIVENRLAIAECYLQLNDLKRATDYLSDNLEAKKLDNLMNKNRLLALYYDKTGDFENSSYHLRRIIRITDSINTNQSELRSQQLATVMDEEKKNTKRIMDALKEDSERQKSEMIAQDERTNMVLISLVFTLLLFSGLVYAYLRSIKNQRLIAEQKYIIENALTEKDSLLKEIHHRVKNNLQMVSSLLSLQTKNTRSKAAIEALEEGKSRVKAMALIHQKLYQNDDLSVIEMQGYIESLINSVQSVYKKGGHNINITIDAEGVELDIDRAIPFGLILNELVSNSFKYAFPADDENGKIYIHLRKVGDKEGYFEYTDNGVGLPDDTDERANSSMGIRLMNRLANQLQTKLNVDNAKEGVRFWFNFA